MSLTFANMNSRIKKIEESLWDIFSRNTVFAYTLEFNIAGFDIFDTFEPTRHATVKYKQLGDGTSIQKKYKVCTLQYVQVEIEMKSKVFFAFHLFIRRIFLRIYSVHEEAETYKTW